MQIALTIEEYIELKSAKAASNNYTNLAYEYSNLSNEHKICKNDYALLLSKYHNLQTKYNQLLVHGVVQNNESLKATYA